MGSCYSTRSNQMPQTKSSNQPSPAFKRTTISQGTNSPKIKTSSSVGTKHRGGGLNGGSFGFRRPSNSSQSSGKQNGSAGIATESSIQSNEAKNTKISKGCSTQGAAPSPARARFGFKKPAIAVSAKVSDGSVHRSSDSLRSTASSQSRDGGSRSSKQSLHKTSASATRSSGYQPVKDKDIRMIDDSETSLLETGHATETLDNRATKKSTQTRPNRLVRNSSLRETNEDKVNANVPRYGTQTDNNANIPRGQAKYLRKPAEKDTDVNVKTSIHSKGTNIGQSTKSGAALKQHSKIGRPQSSLPLNSSSKKSDKIASSHEKENISNKNSESTFRRDDKSHSKGIGRGSFLKKTFLYSKDKSASTNASRNQSNYDADIPMKSEVSVNPDNIEISLQNELILAQKEIVESNIFEEDKNASSETLSDVHLVTLNKHIDGNTTTDTNPENSEISEPLLPKEKIDNSLYSQNNEKHNNSISKNPAPLADLDQLDTISLGSLASDDLMLDVDIDLSGYDDETVLEDNNATGAMATAGGAIRTRSRSGSGRMRMRSSDKMNTSGSAPKADAVFGRSPSDKGVWMDAAGRRIAGGGGDVFGRSPGSDSTKSWMDSARRAGGDIYGRSPGSGDKSWMEAAGARRVGSERTAAEKRDSWHLRQASAVVQENEALGELNALIDQQPAPVIRRFPKLDRANRPASFPGLRCGGGPTEGASGAEGGTSTIVLKPPRTSSVSDDDKVVVDGLTYRQMTQDITMLKTMILRLKRHLQSDELASPLSATPWKNGLSFGGSQPGSPVKGEFKPSSLSSAFAPTASEILQQENQSLQDQVASLQRQLEEQNHTIHLLQTQMTKYERSDGASGAMSHCDFAGKPSAARIPASQQPSEVSASSPQRKNQNGNDVTTYASQPTSRRTTAKGAIQSANNNMAPVANQNGAKLAQSRPLSTGRQRPPISTPNADEGSDALKKDPTGMMYSENGIVYSECDVTDDKDAENVADVTGVDQNDVKENPSDVKHNQDDVTLSKTEVTLNDNVMTVNNNEVISKSDRIIEQQNDVVSKGTYVTSSHSDVTESVEPVWVLSENASHNTPVASDLSFTSKSEIPSFTTRCEPSQNKAQLDRVAKSSVDSGSDLDINCTKVDANDTMSDRGICLSDSSSLKSSVGEQTSGRMDSPGGNKPGASSGQSIKSPIKSVFQGGDKSGASSDQNNKSPNKNECQGGSVNNNINKSSSSSKDKTKVKPRGISRIATFTRSSKLVSFMSNKK